MTIFKKFKMEKAEKPPNGIGDHIRLVSEILLFLFFINTFLMQSFVIPSGSMQNNLLIGDHLLVEKISYSQSIGPIDAHIFPQNNIKRGMIITFKSPVEPDKEYVKRVIGLPGERIRIEENIVYINDSPLTEGYVHFLESSPGQFHGETMSEYEIPAQSYFCMGDNRWNSYDSRFWGPVHRDLIIGRPWLIYWSYQSDRNDYQSTNLFDKIKSIGVTILNFHSKTRWDRTIRFLY